MVAAIHRISLPRPRLLPRVVAAATKHRPSPNVYPVEHDGVQPVLAIIPIAPSAVQESVASAVRMIRVVRGLDKPCGFPNDLGCETQLYLGLAIRKVFPRWTMNQVAEACRVHAPDAIFFATLLDLASRAKWVKRPVLDAAVSELKRGLE